MSSSSLLQRSCCASTCRSSHGSNAMAGLKLVERLCSNHIARSGCTAVDSSARRVHEEQIAQHEHCGNAAGSSSNHHSSCLHVDHPVSTRAHSSKSTTTIATNLGRTSSQCPVLSSRFAVHHPHHHHHHPFFPRLLLPQHQHQYQHQSFSSSARQRQRQRMKSHQCPFRTLGVAEDSTYAEVKKAFLRIAMSHHPDTHASRSNNTTDDDAEEAEGEKEEAESLTREEMEARRQHSINIFLSARAAFESIVQTEDGYAALRSEVELEQSLKQREMSDEEFDAWFKNETGHDTPFQFDIDPATMREVAEMTETVGGGLDRDGGMWHLAHLVSASVKNKKGGGDDATSMLRLEAGDAAGPGEGPGDGRIDGVLRRRRRHGRARR